MATTIEVSASGIRLLRETRGRLSAIESWPVPADADPIATLAQAPLPAPLGKVTVLLHHPDLLLKTMLQPPAPPERLARLIRFELAGMARDDDEPMAIAWHVVKGMGSGDMRVLALLAKRRLIDQLRGALATHGGKLDRLVHPAVGLYHAWRRQYPDAKGDALLVVAEAQHLHLALAQDGELLFLRTVQPGMDELVKQVGELRGIPVAEAAKIVAKIGKGAPADLHELIKRQAQAIAGALQTNVRFAKAQLHLDKFEPAAVWVAGAGAQVHGFVETLGERFGKPARLLNPFAGTLADIDGDELDRHAALPSPWASALGAATGGALELDAVSEDRERRAAFWRGDGAVRVACAAAAVLLAFALVRQTAATSSARTTVAMLKGTADAPGLVPKAEAAHAQLDRLRDERKQFADRLAFIDGERRPGRVALEVLSVIAEQQDPSSCPIVLREYRVRREGAATRVELEGFAESAPRRGTAEVQRTFERELARRYLPLAALALRPKPPGGDRQEFHYILTIPDRTPALKTSPYQGKHGRGLKVDVVAEPGLDVEGMARVAADRARGDEDEVTVAVASGSETTTFLWTAKDGLARQR